MTRAMPHGPATGLELLAAGASASEVDRAAGLPVTLQTPLMLLALALPLDGPGTARLPPFPELA